MNNGQEIIIYNTPDGKGSVALMAKDGNVWLSQDQMAELFDTSKQNIGGHVRNIFSSNELQENSVVKYFFTTAADGKQYRKWANITIDITNILKGEVIKLISVCKYSLHTDADGIVNRYDFEELRLLEKQFKYNEGKA